MQGIFMDWVQSAGERPLKSVFPGDPLYVILSEESACTTESKFCITQRSGVTQNRERDEWKRVAGSPMSFLNVRPALVTFFKRALIAYEMLVRANKRVKNRSQIPRYAIRAPRFCSVPFRSSLRNIHSAKLRLRFISPLCGEIPLRSG